MAWYWPFSGKKQPTSSRTYRSYNGAAFSRLLDDWIASSTSADAESRTAIRTLRNRVRELGRNNDYVVNALRSIQNNVIGNGVKLQAQIKRKRGPGAGDLDDTLNDAIEDAWEFWKRAANCHVAGVLSFSEIERLVARTVASDGEVFVRLVRQKFGSSRIPLALEIIEADLLDENYNGEAPSGNQIRMGVEVDKWFRPVAYHFFTQHPGDIQFGSVGAMEQKRIRVPANEVIHVFRMDRTGQTRGVPWFASAMTRLRHMSGYEEAEVIAARASACYMGFIQTPDPQFEGDMVFEGERTAGFEPGKSRPSPPAKSSRNTTRTARPACSTRSCAICCAASRLASACPTRGCRRTTASRTIRAAVWRSSTSAIRGAPCSSGSSASCTSASSRRGWKWLRWRTS